MLAVGRYLALQCLHHSNLQELFLRELLYYLSVGFYTVHCYKGISILPRTFGFTPFTVLFEEEDEVLEPPLGTKNGLLMI